MGDRRLAFLTVSLPHPPSEPPAMKLILPPLPRSPLAQLLATAIALAITGVAVTVGTKVRRKMQIAKRLRHIDGPKGTFLLGLAPAFYKNLHRLYDYQAELIASYGGRFREPWGLLTDNIVYVSDPKDIEHILSTNMDNYIRSAEFVSSLGPIFEPTLLGLNHAHAADGGARFRAQRKIIARVFTTSRFREFTNTVFQRHAKRTIDVIMAQGGTVEMHAVASQFTLQTIFDIGFGLELEDYDKQLGLSFISTMNTIFQETAARLIYKPYWRYLWWCMPGEYRLKRESNNLLKFVGGILEERLAEDEETFSKRPDILSLAIRKSRELEAEGEGVLDHATLHSGVTGLLFGGRDTISAAIVYSFYNLAQYPAEQDKILHELKSVDVDNLTFEDLKELKYLDAFVWEMLRMNPGTPINSRHAAEDDVLPDGTFIPAGADVFWSTYHMGRNNAKLWGDDQDQFRPSRWLEMKKRPTLYEFPVFHGGQRICPGMNMALLETKVFIAIMLSKFSVRIQEGAQLKDRPYVISMTMMMKDGLPLQLTPRE